MTDTPTKKVGDWVYRGDPIGKCGLTGNTTGPHAHYDCPIANLKKEFGTWRSYVYGWSLERVKRYYDNPNQFVKDTIPMAREFPLVGYHYLQPARGPRGIYYHPGEDLNGVNDLGKQIVSPVEGRVVDIGPMTALARRFNWAKRSLNGGWGCYIVIEEKPGFKP